MTGGAGPGSPGATTPGAPGEHPDEHGSDGWFLGTGRTTQGAPQPSFEELADELSLSGVLPAGEPREKLAQLARLVSQELQAAEERWSELGRNAVGRAAVDDSQYLGELMARGRLDSGRSLLELFTRRAHDKTFVLRGGVWIDRAAGELLPATRRTVTAFSEEYFALLAERPALAPYLSLSSRLIVRLGDEVFEIVDPLPASGDPVR